MSIREYMYDVLYVRVLTNIYILVSIIFYYEGILALTRTYEYVKFHYDKHSNYFNQTFCQRETALEEF